MTTTITTTALTEDARKVYNVGPNTLLELAEKYNVSTHSMAYAKANPDPTCFSLGVQAFPSKSTVNEIRKKLYATIKSQLRDIQN